MRSTLCVTAVCTHLLYSTVLNNFPKSRNNIRYNNNTKKRNYKKNNNNNNNNKEEGATYKYSKLFKITYMLLQCGMLLDNSSHECFANYGSK